MTENFATPPISPYPPNNKPPRTFATTQTTDDLSLQSAEPIPIDKDETPSVDAALEQVNDVHQSTAKAEARRAIQGTFQQTGQPLDETIPQQDADLDQNPDHQDIF